MLRRRGVDLKTAQELLRHANSRITNDLYQQAVSEEKHLANAVVVKALLGDSLLEHPKTPSEGHNGRGQACNLLVFWTIW